MTLDVWVALVPQTVKNLPAMQETPGLGRSPGEENGNPLQYFFLENSMDRGAWWATVHGGHKESDTTEQPTVSLSPLWWCYQHVCTCALPLTHVSLSVVTCTVLPQAPLSMELSRQKTGVDCYTPHQGIFPTLWLPHWQTNSLPLSHLGSPYYHHSRLLLKKRKSRDPNSLGFSWLWEFGFQKHPSYFWFLAKCRNHCP